MFNDIPKWSFILGSKGDIFILISQSKCRTKDLERKYYDFRKNRLDGDRRLATLALS